MNWELYKNILHRSLGQPSSVVETLTVASTTVCPKKGIGSSRSKSLRKALGWFLHKYPGDNRSLSPKKDSFKYGPRRLRKLDGRWTTPSQESLEALTNAHFPGWFVERTTQGMHSQGFQVLLEYLLNSKSGILTGILNGRYIVLNSLNLRTRRTFYQLSFQWPVLT